MTGKRDAEEEIARPIPKRIRRGDSPEEHRRMCHLRNGVRQLMPILWPQNGIQFFDTANRANAAQKIQNALNTFMLEIYNIQTQLKAIFQELNKQRSQMQKKPIVVPAELYSSILEPLKKQVGDLLREFEGIRTSTAMWQNSQLEVTYARNLAAEIRNIQIILANLKNNQNQTRMDGISYSQNSQNRSNPVPNSFPRQDPNTGSHSWRSLTMALDSIKQELNSLMTTTNAPAQGTSAGSGWSVGSILQRMDKPRPRRVRKRKSGINESVSDENMDYTVCSENFGRPLKRARRINFNGMNSW